MGLIILDRDGVINQDSDQHIRRHHDWQAIDGSLEAISRMHKAGHTLVVATNQSGIARGFFSEADLSATHQKMMGEVERAGGLLTDIFYCPHHPDDDCNCRKPKPGLIYQASQRYPQYDLREAFVIGDSWRDILAGKEAECKTILVQTGNGPLALSRHQYELGDTVVVDDLLSAADYILRDE